MSRERENKRLKTAMDKWLGKPAQEETMDIENREFKLHKFKVFQVCHNLLTCINVNLIVFLS